MSAQATGFSRVEAATRRDPSLTEEERAATIAYFRAVPLSTRFASPDPQFVEMSKEFSSRTQFA